MRLLELKSGLMMDKNIKDVMFSVEDELSNLEKAGVKGQKVGRQFANTLLDHIIEECRVNCRKLPGSNKTKRLRKKRIDYVCKWYLSEDNK